MRSLPAGVLLIAASSLPISSGRPGTASLSSVASSCCAFAQGFGSSRVASSSKRTKPKKKRGKFDLDDDLVVVASPPTSVTEETAKLDPWGLPLPTEDDIFPPLPPETKLIPALKENHSLQDIQCALEGYIPLSLVRFDERGVEKLSSDMCSDRLPMRLRLLHQSPPVLAIDNFLTEQECHELEQVAWPSTSGPPPTKRPVQVSSATFQHAISRRTSTSWFCYFSEVPTLLAKMHYCLGLPLEHMEEPQLVRYQAGQEFSWHYDQVPPPQLANGGQRLATLLVYLNSLPSGKGGGTVFRDLVDRNGDGPLGMTPQQGSALLFFPADGKGNPDDRTLHKGEVVADGYEKRIVQVWTHERAMQAILPPDNRQSDALGGMEQVARRLGYI